MQVLGLMCNHRTDLMCNHRTDLRQGRAGYGGSGPPDRSSLPPLTGWLRSAVGWPPLAVWLPRAWSLYVPRADSPGCLCACTACTALAAPAVSACAERAGPNAASADRPGGP